MIRKAEFDDIDTLSQLLYQSGPNLFRYILQVDENKLYKVIYHILKRDGVIYSKDYFSVLEQDSIVKGAISLVPGNEIKEAEKKMVNTFLDIIKTIGLTKTFRMLARIEFLNSFPEIHNDDFFINSIAVIPEFQGQGIASELLKSAFTKARELGFTKISLYVETVNEHAINVYQKYGFKITQTVIFKEKYNKFKLHGIQKMVADVS